MAAAGLNLNLFPKQFEFINAREDEVLYCGGSGAGKSHAFIVKAFLRAKEKGAVEGVTRAINRDLNTSFLMDWRKLIPSELYVLNKDEQLIYIKEGGVIQYFGCDEVSRLGSRNLTGCGIEEAVELKEESWTKLESLIRVKSSNPQQIYAVCNPEGPNHWLAKRFDVNNPNRKLVNKRYIPTNVYDGIQADNAKYLRTLEAKTGVDRKRLLEGLWVENSGAVLDNFSDTRNVGTRDCGGRCILAVDDGDSAPFVILRLYPDAYGRVYVAKEFYRKGMASYDDKVYAVEKAMDEDVEAIIVDMQAGDLIRELRARGLPAVKSEKGAGSIARGIGRIRTLLEPSISAKERGPRLVVSPECPNLIREFRTWSYEASGQPGRENNHALDALRYGIAYLRIGGESKAEEVTSTTNGEAVDALPPEEEYDWGRGEGVNLGIW